MKNEALAQLDGLVGTWDLTITDAWFLDSRDTKVRGVATVEWLRDAFLYLRSDFHDAHSTWDWVFGRSDAAEQLTMLYHDERGTCRVFRVTYEDGELRMERADPDFHQRITGRLAPDRFVLQPEASEDEGRTWRRDFDLVFERRVAT
jgi:hypothetical protein